MLTTWYPWIALAVALIGFVTLRRTPPSAPSEGRLGKAAHMAGALCLVLGLLAVGAAYGFGARTSFAAPAAWGVAAGLALSALLGFLGSRFDSAHRAAMPPAAFGVALIALGGLAPLEPMRFGTLGAIFGLAAGAWILSVAPTPWPALATIAAAGVGALNLLGSFTPATLGTSSGTTLGIAAVLVGILAEALTPSQSEDDITPYGQLFGIVPMAIAGYFTGARLVENADLGTAFAVGSAAGLGLCWIVPRKSGVHELPMAMGLVISLGIATVAYSLERGHGMAAALLGGALAAAFSRHPRAALALAPLAALVVYRLMREMHPDASRAFDIGQHYGLIGLLVGAVAPVLATEWLAIRRASRDMPGVVASMLWVAIWAVLPMGAAIVLGAKGYVGLMAGLGIATALAALKGHRTWLALAIQAGLSALFALQYGWVAHLLDLTRDEKVRALAAVAAALVIFGLGITLLSRTPVQEAPATEG